MDTFRSVAYLLSIPAVPTGFTTCLTLSDVITPTNIYCIHTYRVLKIHSVWSTRKLFSANVQNRVFGIGWSLSHLRNRQTGERCRRLNLERRRSEPTNEAPKLSIGRVEHSRSTRQDRCGVNQSGDIVLALS